MSNEYDATVLCNTATDMAKGGNDNGDGDGVRRRDGWSK